MVKVSLHREFSAHPAVRELFRYGGRLQPFYTRPRAVAIVLCSFLFLFYLLSNSGSEEVYYGKYFKIRAKARHTDPKPHEHILDCSKQALDEPGIDIDIYNPHIAPGFKMNVHRGSDLLSNFVRTLGCFECGIMQDFMQFLATTPLDTFVLDIGGNIGQYSLNAAALGRDVFTFEPLRKNWQRVCRSVRMNPGFEQRITLFNVAVTSAPRIMEFQKSLSKTVDNYGETILQEVSQSQNSLTSSGVKGVDYVPGVPLGSFQELLPSGRPVVLKVDAESFECDALVGAMEYLRTLDILYVQIEWTPRRLHECNQREAIFELFRMNRLTPYQYASPLSRAHSRKRVDPEKWDRWRSMSLFGGLFDDPYFDIVWVRERNT